MSIFQNKIFKNASWIIVCRIVQSLIGLVIGMLTARFLGPSNYGLINYAASVVAFVVPIMQLGFANTIVQEITNNPEDEGKIMGTSIFLSAFTSIFCIAGICCYTLIVDKNEPITNLVVILYSVMLICQAFELMQYWFQAKLLSKYMSITSLIVYMIVAGYKIILLVIGADVQWFAISNSIDYFLIAISLLVIYKRLGGAKLSFSFEIAKKMFYSSKHYIVASLMVTIFTQTDKIMLKLMINEEAVGYYSSAVTCAGMTSFVFGAIIDSFRPVIFAHKKDNNEKAYEKNIERLYCIVIYLALVQSLFMTLLAPVIINILYGSDYSQSILALQIVVWYTTFSYIGVIRNIWILGEGKQRYLWLINLGGATINVLLNLLFINIWGIYGAAFASLLTQIFTNIFMNFIVWPYRYNNLLMLRGLNPKLIFDILKSR